MKSCEICNSHLDGGLIFSMEETLAQQSYKEPYSKEELSKARTTLLCPAELLEDQAFSDTFPVLLARK